MLMEIVHSGHATYFPGAFPEGTNDSLLLLLIPASTKTNYLAYARY